MQSKEVRNERDGVGSPRKSQQTDYSCNGSEYDEGLTAAPGVLTAVAEDADTWLNKSSGQWPSEPDERYQVGWQTEGGEVGLCISQHYYESL